MAWLLLKQLFSYFFWATLLSGAVVLTFAILNASFVSLWLWPEGPANHWRETLPYLTLGTLAALLELSALAAIRKLLGF